MEVADDAAVDKDDDDDDDEDVEDEEDEEEEDEEEEEEPDDDSPKYLCFFCHFETAIKTKMRRHFQAEHDFLPPFDDEENDISGGESSKQNGESGGAGGGEPAAKRPRTAGKNILNEFLLFLCSF